MGAVRYVPDLTRTEDFLAWVWEQDYKFEEINGRLVMMAGGSRVHARIAGNAYSALDRRLEGKRCLPYNSDFLVQIGKGERYYSDVTVACDERRDFTDAPVLVIEVLSTGTATTDLGEKLAHYLEVPGLRHTLYLWQDQPRARLWNLDAGPDAPPQDIVGLGASVSLPGLDLELTMAELYRDVDFAQSETV